MKITVVQPDLIAVLTRIAVALEAVAANTKPEPHPSDLRIDFHLPFRSPTMLTAKLLLKSPLMKQVMQPITLTTNTPALTLVTVDQNGQPITVDPTKVTTTLNVDDTIRFAIVKVDETHYIATIPAGATGVVNVTATEVFTDGSFGPFNASIAITLPLPPSPTPTDLQIIIG